MLATSSLHTFQAYHQHTADLLARAYHRLPETELLDRVEDALQDGLADHDLTIDLLAEAYHQLPEADDSLLEDIETVLCWERPGCAHVAACGQESVQ